MTFARTLNLKETSTLDEQYKIVTISFFYPVEWKLLRKRPQKDKLRQANYIKLLSIFLAVLKAKLTPEKQTFLIPKAKQCSPERQNPL